MAKQKPENPFQYSFYKSADQAIYRDAISPNLISIDISTIDKNSTGLSRKWVHHLLKDGNAEIKVHVKPDVKSSLFHLYFEGQNILKLNGQKTIGFAYPLYIEKKTANKPGIAAPLFIWHLDLIPEEDGTWIIRHNKKLSLFPNEYLLHYLKDRYGTDLSQLCMTLCKTRQLNSISLSKVCHQLSSALGLKTPENNEIINYKAFFESTAVEKSAILKTGLIGIFPSQGSPNPPEPASHKKPLINLYSPQHNFCIARPDPSQNQAIQTIFDHRTTWIEGAGGTGKSFTLSNILSTALSNGRKCLVVSDQLEVFDKIQAFFHEIRLGHLNIRMIDLNYDLEDIFRSLREKEISKKVFDSEQYRFIVNKCKRLQFKLHDQFKLMEENIFDHDKWQDIVGKFLSRNREEGKELLNSQLNPQDFDFIIPEYESMKKAVKESKTLYQRVKTFLHPLRFLHRNVFLNLSKDDALFFTETQLTSFLIKARTLHHRYILKQDDYSRKLRAFYGRHIDGLFKNLDKIKEGIEDFVELYGEDFIESGLMNVSRLKVYGVFSNRAKNILQARSQINTQFLELKEAFERWNYFDFTFYENVETKNTHKINAQLEAFEAAMQEWQQELNLNIQEELQRLSNKTVHSSLDYQEQIDELEYSLDLMIGELNTTQIYTHTFQNKMLTIPMRQQFLEDIIEQLEESKNNLRDFDAFYDWNRYWLSLPEILQKLIRAIVKVKPKNWMAAFESWYFHHLLNQHYNSRLPQNNTLFQGYIDAWQQLAKMMPDQISKLWNERFQDSKKTLKRNDKTQYQLLFKSSPEASYNYDYKRLFDAAFETITDGFPIIMASPAVAERILNIENAYFDFIGIYQSTRNKLSRWSSLSHKANHFTFSTDDVASPLEITGQSPFYRNAQKIKLQYLHLNKTLNLSSFINAAFYNHELEILYKTDKSDTSMEIQALNGRYQSKLQTNKKEAEFIVKFLSAYKSESGASPKIGIACATVGQRNLISSLFIQQLSNQFTLEDFDVFTFEELKGAVFDILFVSIVYDKIPFQNKQQVNFNYATPAFRLKALFSSPLKKLILCHSFSEDQLNGFSKQVKDKAPFLLAQFIQFAAACKSKDLEKQAQILNIFPSEPTPKNSNDNIFLDEIALALSPYFEEGRILRNVEFKGISLPLIIKSDQQDDPPVAIVADGFLYSHLNEIKPMRTKLSSPAYLWEHKIREQLKQQGIKSYAVWSVNWWKNPKLEARKLASAVIKMGNSKS